MLIPSLPALPIVDISPFLLNIQGKEQASREMHLACRDMGFLYIVGHQLHQNELEDIRNVAREFFSYPPAEKEEISIQRNDNARGYQRLGQNVTYNQRDWHEGVDLYAPVTPEHTLVKTRSKILAGSNPIPKRPSNFASAVDSYVLKMKRIGQAVMHAIAMGLGLQEDYFDPTMADSFWVMRMIGYPPLAQNSENTANAETLETSSDLKNVGMSCGEHTDYGCLTILNTDETTGALQVLSRSGHWIDADPIPGALVVNIGDMLNILTNDMYHATLHRVIHKKQSYRVSVPFFYEPNFDAVIAPIPKCVKDTGGKEKHASVVYGQHLLSKVSNNFDINKEI